jgi:hypothetical protein
MAYTFTRKTDNVDDVMAADVNELQAAIEAHEFLTLEAATELTIDTGEITAVQACHKLQPESGTEDDLDTINGMDEGDILVLYASDVGTDTITIKHGTGNLSCVGAADIEMANGAVICYYDGTTVYVAGGGGGGGATGATGPTGLSELSSDSTPQLGGDLDLNDHNIILKFEPTDDDTSSGLQITATVDENTTGIGNALSMGADGHFEDADYNSVDDMPCIALALETGTGSKKILLHGVMRNDDWNWTTGEGAAGLVYVGTGGALTQTKPTGEDDVVQPVGFALSDDCIYFCPSMLWITHTA